MKKLVYSLWYIVYSFKKTFVLFCLLLTVTCTLYAVPLASAQGTTTAPPPAAGQPAPATQTNPIPNNVPNMQGPGRNTFSIEQPPGYGVSISTGNPVSAEGAVGTIMKNVVTLLFTVGGIGGVVYFLWGAVDWIFAGGDKEKVASARKKITHALIGLTILALSFVIIRVIGEIVGFNPLGGLQIRGLGDGTSPYIVPK